MFRLLLLLSATLFATMLIGGRDHGQLRFGLLGIAESERASAATLPVVPARPATPEPVVVRGPPAADAAVVRATFPAAEPLPVVDPPAQPPKTIAPARQPPPLAEDAPAAAPEGIAEEPGLPVLYVTGSSLNIREGPSTRFAIVGRLVRDEAVIAVAAPENGWVRIRRESDGAEGFVAARLLTDQGPELD